MRLHEALKYCQENFSKGLLLRLAKTAYPQEIPRIERMGEQAAREFIQARLTDPDTYRYAGQIDFEGAVQTPKETPSLPKIEVSRVEIKIEDYEEELPDEDEGLEYPERYPERLVQLLIEARKMTRKKRSLSNSLHEKQPQSAFGTVKEILGLSEKIDELYAVKRVFDTKGYLPVKYSEEANKLANEIEGLQHELANTRARISKNKAKLKNPSEKIQKELIQDKVKEDEKLRAEIKDKLHQLRTTLHE